MHLSCTHATNSPGTGKTVTIVEAIKQLIRNDQDARILVCAPSNSAADIVTIRLTDTTSRGALSKEELFRAVAPSRLEHEVAAPVLPFTYRKGSHFSVEKGKLKSYRVVVSTCVSSSIVSGIGTPRGHYTHIFVDEAGQAAEPEIMVAVKQMTGPKTNVVLSGDPKQLGPVIRSPIARELGFGKSYLERLMDGDVYSEEGGFDGRW
jgi:helicase MOV-10